MEHRALRLASTGRRTEHLGDPTAVAAEADFTVAYNDAAGRTLCPVSVAGNLGGLTLSAGLYKSTSSVAISSGDLTLDAMGNANAVSSSRGEHPDPDLGASRHREGRRQGGQRVLAGRRLCDPRNGFAGNANDRAKYEAIGESDRMTLKFRKP